jgi:glycosyltransferase involved in cell wall biosynthesis
MNPNPRAPKVSVVLVFLNEENFLAEAVDSVYQQSYSDWELILVDDGSTDGSSSLARSFSEKEPGRVFYVEHEGHINKGMSSSRNRGRSCSRGEYIAFLDADDTLMPNALSEQVDILQANASAALVYGPSLYWRSWEGDREQGGGDALQKLGAYVDQIVRPPSLLLQFLENEARTPGGAMIRKCAFDDVQGYVEAFRGMHEDQAFFSRFFRRFPAYVSGNCWRRYRQHSSSCVSVTKKAGVYSRARMEFLEWLMSDLSPGEPFFEEITSAVERQIGEEKDGTADAARGTLNRVVGPGLLGRLRVWARSLLRVLA